jgi:hypothetical protein
MTLLCSMQVCGRGIGYIHTGRFYWIGYVQTWCVFLLERGAGFDWT